MLTPKNEGISFLPGTEADPTMRVIYNGATIEVPEDIAARIRALFHWNPAFPQLVLGDVVLALIERGLLVFQTPGPDGPDGAAR